MKTNHNFQCKDVRCIFKYLSYNTDNPNIKPHRCKLNNNIAKQIFEEYGLTTCELGMGQHDLTLTEKRNLYRTINQMIREEKTNGNL